VVVLHLVGRDPRREQRDDRALLRGDDRERLHADPLASAEHGKDERTAELLTQPVEGPLTLGQAADVEACAAGEALAVADATLAAERQRAVIALQDERIAESRIRGKAQGNVDGGRVDDAEREGGGARGVSNKRGCGRRRLVRIAPR
jgi:hypothetical protein